MEAQKSIKEDWFLWSLLVLVLALGAFYFFLVLPSQNSNDSPTWIFGGVEAGSIQSLRSLRGGETKLKITRPSSKHPFKLRQPQYDHSIPLSSDKIQTWLETILEPSIQQRFSGSQQADYGFQDSDKKIEMVQGSSTHELHIGADKPVGSGFYVRYGSEPTGPMFVLSDADKKNFYRTLDEIRRKDLFTISIDELTQVSLNIGEKKYQYQKDKNWKLTRPREEELNDTETKKLTGELESLLSIRADSFFDTEPPKSFKPLNGTVKLTVNNESIQVMIGGTNDKKRLVRRSDWPVVATVRDPIALLQEIPHKSEQWPDAIEADGKDQSQNQSPPSMGSGFNAPAGLQGESK